MNKDEMIDGIMRASGISKANINRFYDGLVELAKKKLSAELADRYRHIIGIDTRLQRLDRAVAENERRIYQLTREAQKYTAQSNPQRLRDALKAAERLQHHNSRLLKIIVRTEAKLTRAAMRVVNKTKEVDGGG